MRCRCNKSLSDVVFTECLSHARLIAGSHERTSLSPNDGAVLQEKRGENKAEACGAGVWKTGTTETHHHQLHHYRHPHLRDLAQATSCHWRLFMSELGKDQ